MYYNCTRYNIFVPVVVPQCFRAKKFRARRSVNWNLLAPEQDQRPDADVMALADWWVAVDANPDT